VIPRDRLHATVDGFAGRRIVVYGDLVLDRFVLGTPKRISREAPVIILRFEDQRDVPGGAANALANVAALGGTALPVGAVGDDEPGHRLLEVLGTHGVDTSGVLVVAGWQTVTKVRVLAGGPSSLKHQVARYDVEAVLDRAASVQSSLLARLLELAPEADGAAISDYGYGVVGREEVGRLRAALPAGTLAVADSRFALTELAGVDGATPNLEELETAAGKPLEDDDAVAAAAETLRRQMRARFLVATRGSKGLTLVEEDSPPFHVPVHGTDQVADVTGAGDTVLATLTLALAAGAPARDAAVLANLAGGVVVTKLGTATLSAAELHRAIDLASFLDG
jgi:D-glycero-beta-D-manno-heptose-7-phosphate kinase